MQIVNALGEVMRIQNIHAERNTIEVAGWSSGIYFIMLSHNNQIQVRKIVVK